MKYKFGLRALILSSVIFGSNVTAVSAETLKDALIAAYQGNPTLNADRARQRATDEQVPQALSGWRPVITASGSVSHKWDNSSSFSGGSESSPGQLRIDLSQPLFRGFKTVEGTAQAEANVRVGRQQLLSVEQTTLFNAVQAYLNVVQGRQILALRQENIAVLQKQASASSARFKAGELTRTDVSQAQASVSSARGQAASALATLQAAEANYFTITGHIPKKLATPHMAKRPHNLEEALETAHQTNPSILAAVNVVDAAEHNVEVLKGDLLPSANLAVSASVNDDLGTGVHSTDITVGGNFTVPLYEAGRVYANVRQAKQFASQNRIQVIGAVRAVRENVTAAWNNVNAAGQSLNANQAQVAASRLALDGVQQEYAVGSRSTIDVLNAQQSLLVARISQVIAQHDQLLYSFQLLQAMGLLTAQYLGLGEIYDPTQHYDETRNKWIGLDTQTIVPVR